MKQSLSVACAGLLGSLVASALVPSVGEAQAIFVTNCSQPVTAGAGDTVTLTQNVTCTQAQVAGWPGGATSFITLAPGARLNMQGRSIAGSNLTSAVTAIKIAGASGAAGATVDGGLLFKGMVKGFARALDAKGDNHQIEDLRIEQNQLKPLPLGASGKQANAAVVLHNGSNTSFKRVWLRDNSLAAGAQAAFTTALAVWGDAPGASAANHVSEVLLSGNRFSSKEGANPSPLPPAGEAPPAPPGPPIITDPTPDGGGPGQTLSTIVLMQNATGNELSSLSLLGNVVTTQTEVTAALSGLVSLEACVGNSLDGISISLNDVLATAYQESQAGFVALTESDANEVTNLTVSLNSARAGRAAGGVVVAVGKSNAIHDVDLSLNTFKAGSFTGGLFLFGELTSPARTTGGNQVSGVQVNANYYQSLIGNASVFLFSAFANNFEDISVASNLYLFYGFDVWDFGIFGTTGCSPAAFSPVFVPFPLPPLNYWNDIDAAVVVPFCIGS